MEARRKESHCSSSRDPQRAQWEADVGKERTLFFTRMRMEFFSVCRLHSNTSSVIMDVEFGSKAFALNSIFIFWTHVQLMINPPHTKLIMSSISGLQNPHMNN